MPNYKFREDELIEEFSKYIDQTYDIASSDIVGGNIVFNVHSSATPAGIYTFKMNGLTRKLVIKK